MNIRVRFLGLSRLATGEREIDLVIDEGTSFREIVRLLGRRYPELLGDVIQPDGITLQEPNAFNLNSQRVLREQDMDDAPKNGDCIILMSISAGG
jgi:molybdopterin converting factor small subunit